jgi:SAM-dependent methyltransferase
MAIFDRNVTGVIILRVSWKSDNCSHDDYFYCHPVNLWRDIMPPQLAEKLLDSREGDQFSVMLASPPFPHQKHLVHSLSTARFQQGQAKKHGSAVLPRLGRWYPQRYAAGLPGIFSDSIRPMRVIEINSRSITVDCNHPLAGREIELGVSVDSITCKAKERGGRCFSWLDDATDHGPGMQALLVGLRPDFSEGDGMRRLDEQTDTRFYQSPRLVDHIDRQASYFLQEFLGSFLSSATDLLDLMAGYKSHLPGDFAGRVTGLGLNDLEMRKNPCIQERIVHDLNLSPIIPFADESFGAVLCNMSFEYLIRPDKICREILRILKPGGSLVISVSDRWFPTKVTRLWKRLHPFERVGYILDNLREGFVNLSTTSYVGWPRPADDPHRLPNSDPLFLIAARKSESKTND